MRYAYGLTVEDYEELLAKQGGKCAICRKSPSGAVGTNSRYLHVDHDHVTGKVRALLCTKCNALIGMADESITRLAAAARYLRSHR